MRTDFELLLIFPKNLSRREQELPKVRGPTQAAQSHLKDALLHAFVYTLSYKDIKDIYEFYSTLSQPKYRLGKTS